MKNLFISVILIFPVLTAAEERQLSAEEVTAAYSAMNVYGHHVIKEGVNGVGWFAPDGSLKTETQC